MTAMTQLSDEESTQKGYRLLGTTTKVELAFPASAAICAKGRLAKRAVRPLGSKLAQLIGFWTRAIWRP